jgi:hypothetical protein
VWIIGLTLACDVTQMGGSSTIRLYDCVACPTKGLELRQQYHTSNSFESPV